MQYETFEFPYEKRYGQYTPKALTKLFAVVREQMPARISNIGGHLERELGVRVTPNSEDETLNQIPSWIASLGRLRRLSHDEFESTLEGTRAVAVDAMRYFLSREELDGETLSMVFDAALLWGEAFRSRWPDAVWGVGTTPRSSVYYGQPVLTGIDPYRSEFCPRVELHGFVGLTLKGQPTKWTLSEIMDIRAYSLGFAPHLAPPGIKELEAKILAPDRMPRKKA